MWFVILNLNTRFLKIGNIIFNDFIMNLKGPLCKVDKHLQSFPGLFYEATTRLCKVLNLFYENIKVKVAKNSSNICLQKNFSHSSFIIILFVRNVILWAFYEDFVNIFYEHFVSFRMAYFCIAYDMHV